MASSKDLLNDTDGQPTIVHFDGPYSEFNLTDSEDGELDNEKPKPIKTDPQDDDYDFHKRRKNKIPYLSVYESVEESENRGCFIPGEPVKATIIDVQRDTAHAMHMFNPYVYTIQLEHGRFKWTVAKRYKDFYSLHNHFVMYKAAQAVAAPFRKLRRRKSVAGQPVILSYEQADGLVEGTGTVFEHSAPPIVHQVSGPQEVQGVILERRNTWPHIEFTESPDAGTTEAPTENEDKDQKLPRFPGLPDSMIGEENVEQRRSVLEGYLNRLLSIPAFRKHREMLEFLEVSHLSFVNDLGDKGKEGLVSKYQGGHHEHLSCLKNPCRCCAACRKWQTRWLLTKDSFVAYLIPHTNTVREVMLFDSDFEVSRTANELQAVRHGLFIKNFSRDLIIKVDSDREANDWKLSIENVLQTKGKMWKEFNRFGSFYPVRSESYAKWFADGATLFDHVAEMMSLAEEEIFITDWWLTPEILLRRPADIGDDWQLMELLKRKARQGVRVYVMLFKEIQQVMMVGSAHAKEVLMSLHPNILVVRHPDPVPPTVWTHHEKMVIVDQRVAFIGGIDLNYGRYDDYTHKLTDLGPQQNIVTETLSHKPGAPPAGSPGIPMMDEFGSEEELQHRPVSDVSNGANIVRDSYRASIEQDPVSLRHPSETDVSQKPTVNDVINKFDEFLKTGKAREKLVRQNTPPTGRRKSRVGKAIEGWKEKHMPQEPSESDLIYKEYEEMIKRMGVDTEGKLWIGKDYTNWYLKDVVDVEHPYIDLVDRCQVPRVPWHDLSSVVYGPAGRDAARHFIQRWNQIKSEKLNYDNKYPFLVPKSYDDVHIPKSWREKSFPCIAQVVRSGALWSCGINCVNESIHQAYIHIIESAEHYVYIENQFFISMINNTEVSNRVCQSLFNKIVNAHKYTGRNFRVYILLPLMPAFAGELGTMGGMNGQSVLYWTYKSILRGPNSLFANLEKEIGDYSEYVGFYGLRTHAELCGKLVTEVVYIHSKAVIVDDRYAIIGSANLNDRSFKGDRDSEVCIYIEDTEFVKSRMDSKPYKSGRFAGSFRRHLLSEHLGLLDEMGKTDTCAKIDITDMVSNKVFDHISRTARNNTEIYEKVFWPYPTDSVKTWADLERCKKEKDFCLAARDKKKAMDLLSGVEGYLVEFPLHFLSGEDLNPPPYMYQNIGHFAVV